MDNNSITGLFSGGGDEICVAKISYNPQDVLGHGSHGTVVFK